MYVDSLWLFAASSPTGIVAQLGARWIALLHFLGSNRIPAGEFFSILYLFVFCTQICVSFQNIFTYSKKHQGKVAL